MSWVSAILDIISHKSYNTNKLDLMLDYLGVKDKNLNIFYFKVKRVVNSMINIVLNIGTI